MRLLRRGLRALSSGSPLAAGLGYAAAVALYVLIGVLVPDFLLSVFVGIGYLLIVAWAVPAALRRLL